TGQPERLNAVDSADPLLRSSHLAVQALRAGGAAVDGPQAALIDGPRGQPVQLAHVRIRDKAGLDWLIVVAVPRSDFLQNVTDNATRSLWLGLLAALAVVGIGLVSLEVLSRDLRKIGVAARQVGDGHFDLPLDVSRSDEIGDLARSFSAMKQRLATDPLTGLASREAILRRAEDRLQQQRRAADRAPFALLFIDVNGFKQINDRHGHGVGDQVLVELGRRLRSALRSSDSLGRLAGDEFLLLIDQIGSEDQLAPLLAALHQRLAEPLVCLQAAGVGAANEDAGISVAIGVALSPRDGQDLISLLHHADADMYRRKPGAQALEA
ncbi:diguanylate cyclase domain-containing protein, partial [Ideonella sp.]|uniref:diguanylate cyclase domain-containing protein n=1 Tax=Ideonella sp. TaxID=1929293 RepID=UPI003BB49001